MPPKRKRGAAEATADEDGSRVAGEPSSKRARRTATSSIDAIATRKSSAAGIDTTAIDEIDLVEEENTLSRTRQKQLAEQVKAQQGEQERDKPAKLSTLTCVICLETPTDLTATTCGHLFCHRCLMEALIAGENRSLGAGEARKSQCPVCRKNLNRTKKLDIIPLLMKKGISSQPRKKAAKGGQW